jgi:effector-binding domain-containing protein
MKKWLLVPGIFLLLFLTVCIIIPHRLTISTVALLKANAQATSRYLADENNWQKIFSTEVPENSFRFNQFTFTVSKKLSDGVEVLISKDGVSDSSLIQSVRLNYDSSIIRWTAVVETSSNPFKKVERYFAANEIKNNMEAVLDTMKRILEREENIYGIAITRAIVKDTLLIVTKNTFNHYPSSRDIYSLIRSLQTYASVNNAKQSGYPMLDIKTIDNTNFQTMVALPVDNRVNDHAKILNKEMVAGNILVAEVHGGPYTVTKAFNNLHDYVIDHDLQSPAIPFQSLITDRLEQPDTTKWITKIYYPIY